MNYNVLGENYKIKYVNKVDDQDSSGECDRGTKTILIKKELKGGDKIETELHEFLHAYWWESGVSEVVPLFVEEFLNIPLVKSLVKNFNITSK